MRLSVFLLALVVTVRGAVGRRAVNIDDNEIELYFDKLIPVINDTILNKNSGPSINADVKTRPFVPGKYMLILSFDSLVLLPPSSQIPRTPSFHCTISAMPLFSITPGSTNLSPPARVIQTSVLSWTTQFLPSLGLSISITPLEVSLREDSMKSPLIFR